MPGLTSFFLVPVKRRGGCQHTRRSSRTNTSHVSYSACNIKSSPATKNINRITSHYYSPSHSSIHSFVDAFIHFTRPCPRYHSFNVHTLYIYIYVLLVFWRKGEHFHVRVKCVCAGRTLYGKGERKRHLRGDPDTRRYLLPTSAAYRVPWTHCPPLGFEETLRSAQPSDLFLATILYSYFVFARWPSDNKLVWVYQIGSGQFGAD